MKDRLVTALVAVILCLIVLSMFFQATGDEPVPRPLSTEPGRNGYLALNNWLTDEGIDVASWQERLDSLLDDEQPLGGAGNIMLTTMPHRYTLRDTEKQALDAWIRRGNTLLIMAAVNDSPEWLESLSNLGAITGATWFSDLAELTEVSFRVKRDGSGEFSPFDQGAEPVVEPGETVVLLPSAHPLMQGVESLEAVSDGVSSIWIASLPTGPARQTPLIRVAFSPGFAVDAAWQRPRGAGQILLVSSASLFTNGQIDEADNGRFIANMIGHHLGATGTFIFDDMHQGLSSLYDPDAFFADSRLHATIAFLVAGWLVYVLGSSNRLAPARPPERAPRQVDLLAATGGFMARRIEPRATGLMLFDEWFDEIRANRSLDRDAHPPWEALAAMPTLRRKLLERLREFHDRLLAGNAVDLVELNNLLRQSRKALG